MEEIKFKAWHIKEKKMFYVSGLQSNSSGVKFVFIYGKVISPSSTTFIKVPTNKVGIKNVILLQYTGLKDKKEKEIYQGDLVKDKNGEIREVIWYMTGFYFKYIENKDRKDELVYSKDLKIIGNIYENLELLK